MRICSRWLVVIAWLSFCCRLLSQAPDYTQFSLDDHLASATVYHSIQDRQGFIWFATESGISRFDGVQFQNYTVRDGLAGNDVLRLYEDRAGRIWCLAFQPGICYWEAGKFHNAATDPWLGAVKARNFFISMIEDAQGDLWVADDGGRLLRLNAEKETVQDSLFSGLRPGGGYGFFRDGSGAAVAVCNAFAQPLLLGRAPMPIEPQMAKWLTTRVAQVAEGAAVCAVGNRAVVVSGRGVEAFPLPGEFAEADILGVSLDRQGNLWFGTRDGALMLSRFTVGNGGCKYGELRHFLPGKTITHVLEDHEGNHWMTSSGEGVFFFASIHALTYHPPAEAGAFVNKVFVDSRGVVWVGFDRGYYGKLLNGTLEVFQIPGTGNGRGRTNDIFEDRAGNVFLANDEWIVIVEPSGKIHYHKPYAKAVVQMPDGDYYLSHGWQVNRVQAGDVSGFGGAYQEARRSNDLQFNTRVSSMAVSDAGKLLLGTLHGLQEVQAGELRRIEAVPEVAISGVLAIPGGRVWLSTSDHGVGYLEAGKYWPQNRDLPGSGICHGLAMGPHGVVYVATNGGLARIAPVDGRATKFQTRGFGKSYGLASEDVRSVATSRGKVYVATAKGLTVIDEAFLTGGQLPVRLQATAFTGKGTALALDGEMQQLSADDNRLSLAFNGISYRNANDVRYAFSLSKDQAHVAWTPTTSRRLDFSYLRPGDYRLQLAAMIEGLPATRATVTLDFVVLPKFWETSWARVLIVLVASTGLGAIVWGVLRRRRRREQAMVANRKRITELEQRALRAQMNPHFIFNSLNSIERFYITNRIEDANRFIGDFSELIRAVLEYSTRAFITLAEEMRLAELVLTLEAHRRDHRFDFEIAIDPGISVDDTMIPPMVLQPFIENAIWHGVMPLEGRRGKIVLHVDAQEHGTRIVVRDNGIGRKKSTELKSKYRQKHNSKGIQITAERFELLNLDLVGKPRYSIQVQDLLDGDGVALGTEVVMFVPNTTRETL